ncbi:hypothetical protein [Mongoliibacter ruber]|uniref:DUF4421 domain-containing protein n=1 Tax=Mongoliibacter ruber TaxID=1750599 RepID=A0A2T0WKI4_9BACT|nr:hypothetical protein [Mongoliibacter ruber]PRY87218.1 hypothetical protein CLW00_107288 [Mongoliibacter ruber]
MKKFTLVLSLFLSSFIVAFAQDDIFGLDTKARPSRKSSNELGNIARNFVSLFSVELSGGGAYYKHLMNFNSESPSQYPIGQYQNLQVPRELSIEDTIRLSSGNYAFPVNIGVRVNLFNTLTIGGGYGREFGRVNFPVGDNYRLLYEQESYVFDKFYGTVGLVLYDARKRVKFLNWRYRKYASQNIYMQGEKNQRIRQNYPWRFIAEGEFGNLILRQNLDSRLAQGDQPFYGIALRIEREFSEYTRLFVKAGAEFRNFAFQAESLNEFQNLQQTLYVAQVGFSISLPGTKRCKVPGCGVVMRHLHEGVEYRGSSIFRFQNRKVGQWYGN